jgi:hypothetical protein
MSSNVRNLAAPNFAVASKEYDSAWQDQFINVLRLHLNNSANAINAPKVFGSYYDTTTQTNLLGTNLITYSTTIIGYNTKIGSPTSRVFVSETGIYNIQFSAQLDKTGGGADAIYIWLRVNGADVANSASKVVVNGNNDEKIAAWNFVIQLQSNDYIELAWSSTDATMHIEAIAASTVAPVHPFIPSVILTVTWVSNPPV